MNTFLFDQIIFFAIILALLVIPGWLFLSAFFHRDHFAPIEKIVLSIPISFALITLLVIAIDALGIALTKNSLMIALGSMMIPFIAGIFVKKIAPQKITNYIFTFSKTQTLLIILIIIMTIGIKGAFLVNTVFPTATDLGHHMFWVEKITQEHALPTYQKIKIVESESTYTYSDPEKIADFIVGEHIIFAVVKLFTQKSVVSPFPSLILFIFNVFTALMIFILSRRIFARYAHGDLVAIMTLLMIGPLWSISGAGAKFVSGGVIGNVIGNLLIPATLYFVYRSLTMRRAVMIIPAIVLVTALAYTHHLSAFIFGYIFMASIVIFALFQKNGWRGYKNIFLLLKNYYIIPILLIAVGSILLFHPPSYLDSETIASSVGTPSKSTRIGIPFSQMMYMLGETRFVLGLIGLFVLIGFMILWRSNKLAHIGKKYYPVNIYGAAFLIGWTGVLMGMSMFPHLLMVNILSSRIATYGAFPLAILAGFFIVWIGSQCLRHKDHHFLVPHTIAITFLLILMTYSFVTGLRDNATSMNDAPKTSSALQTFHAGAYANAIFGNAARAGTFWMVKDHSYIVADTWIKVFFSADYTYPLSRSFFQRYENNPDREHCTLYMITEPDSLDAQKCFDDLSIRAVLVNSSQDSGQFTRLDGFYRIYQNNELSLFLRK